MKLLARIALLALFVCLLTPTPAQAAVGRAGQDAVTVPQEQVIDDDLYAAGDNVTVAGTVKGDVIAVGSTMTIDGTVDGNVWVLGGKVFINGTVHHSVHVLGGTVHISGHVDGDVLAGGSDVIIEAPAVIGRDLIAGSSTLSERGQVGRNALFAVDRLNVAGPIKGDVRAESGESFKLERGANIGGLIQYSGPRELQQDPAAVVAGKIDFTKTTAHKQPNYLEQVWGQLYWFLASLLLLIAILLYARQAAETAAGFLTTKVGWSMLAGLGFLIAAPIFMFILLLTIVGIPLSFIALLFYGLILYSAKLFVALSAGQMILKRPSTGFWTAFTAGALGLAIFYALSVVPGIGPLIVFITAITGSGAQLLLFKQLHDDNRKKYGA